MAATVDPPTERPADFGGRMKRLREERGVELREIAETTKISVSVLEALERNDISRLPGGIFSRGFVRAYAAQIGADPDIAVRDFIARFPHDVPAAEPDGFGRSQPSASVRARIALAMAMAILAAGAAVAGWWLYVRG